MTQDKTKKPADGIIEERIIPPKPPGRVAVEDPEEKYGEPELYHIPKSYMDEARQKSFDTDAFDREMELFRENIDADTMEKITPLFDFIREVSGKSPIDPDKSAEYEMILTTAYILGKQMRDRYIELKEYSKDSNGDAEKILSDAKKTLDAITKEDFQAWIGEARNDKTSPFNPEKIAKEEGRTKEEVLLESAEGWLKTRCKIYEYALKEWGLDTQPLTELIGKRAFAISRKIYRQAKNAKETIERHDGRTPLITHPDYQGALSIEKAGNAFLQDLSPDLLSDADKKRFDIADINETSIEFNDGNIFLSIGDGKRRLMKAQLQNMKTGEHILNLDTGLINIVWGFFLSAKQEGRSTERLRIRTPDLFLAQTGKKNVDTTTYFVDEDGEDILDKNGNKKISHKGYKDRVMERVQKNYQNLGGIVYEGGREPSVYPPLVFIEYNEPEDTFVFASSYMEKIYSQMEQNRETYQVATQYGTKVLEKPYLSHMIKSTLYNEKNLIAVRNVEIIVETIETAGINVHETHLAVRTIISRNERLSQKLENDIETSNGKITRDLQRAFKKTYELLQTHTHLQDKYKELELPKHPEDTPTVKDYKTKVLTFKHKGLNKDYE